MRGHNVYHAILQGVNKQHIFEDEYDYMRFLDILRTQTVPEVNPAAGEAKPRAVSMPTASWATPPSFRPCPILLRQ